MQKWVLALLLLLSPKLALAAEWNANQRLTVACFRLDLDAVYAALRQNADVNARFTGDAMVFRDTWTGGWPMASKDWTPLLALANASVYPDPPEKLPDERMAEQRDKRIADRAKIPDSALEPRRRAIMTIAAMLIAQGALIDRDDGYGATPLHCAIDDHKLDLSKFLIRCGAKVNTKTHAYIDGPSDLTPLHQALWSAELTKLLLDRGADPQAKTTWGGTPASYAKDANNPAIRAMLPATRVAAVEPSFDPQPTAEKFVTEPLETWRNAETLQIDEVEKKYLPDVATRIGKLPNLRSIVLSQVELDNVPVDLPISTSVNSIFIHPRSLSPAAMNWLSRFSAVKSLSISGDFDTNLSGLSFNFKSLQSVHIEYCHLSVGNLQEIFDHSSFQSFQQCTIEPATKPTMPRAEDP